jgi:hypothetical protein
MGGYCCRHLPSHAMLDVLPREVSKKRPIYVSCTTLVISSFRKPWQGWGPSQKGRVQSPVPVDIGKEGFSSCSAIGRHLVQHWTSDNSHWNSTVDRQVHCYTLQYLTCISAQSRHPSGGEPHDPLMEHKPVSQSLGHIKLPQRHFALHVNPERFESRVLFLCITKLAKYRAQVRGHFFLERGYRVDLVDKTTPETDQRLQMRAWRAR